MEKECAINITQLIRYELFGTVCSRPIKCFVKFCSGLQLHKYYWILPQAGHTATDQEHMALTA